MNALTVLTWHNAGPTWCFPAPPGNGLRGMDAQFRALARVTTVIPLEEGLDRITSGRRLPSRAVAITFDDGYRDTLTDAVPLLRRYRLPATVFLVPGLLSGAVDPWWETLSGAVHRATVRSVVWRGMPITVPADPGRRRPVAESLLTVVKGLDADARMTAVEEVTGLLAPSRDAPAAPMFMDWDEARRLRDEPLVTIGSHSRDHTILANESAARQHADLAESRSVLQRGLDVPVRTLSYPVGSSAAYSAETVAAARSAGYDYAVTTGEGLVRPGVDPLQVPRFVMSPERGIPGFLTLTRPALRSVRRRAARVSPRRRPV